MSAAGRPVRVSRCPPGGDDAGPVTRLRLSPASARVTRLAARPALRTTGRWVLRLLPLLGVAGMVAAVGEVRGGIAVLPAALGLSAWTLANYLGIALRWRSVSGRGLGARWYVRVFAEGELLGLLTPQHSGALYWRARQLRRAGADTSGALCELSVDRACSASTVLLALLVGGAALPGVMRLAAYGIVAASVLVVWASRRRWLHRVPTLDRRTAVRWFGYSVLFQVGYAAFMIDMVRAVGLATSWTSVVGLLSAAQVASVLPGIHGAGPKEGVLAGGLVATGASHASALGLVGLVSAVAWVPALLLGGSGLALRALGRARHGRHVVGERRAGDDSHAAHVLPEPSVCPAT